MNMLTAEFNLEEYKQVKYLEGKEEVQNYVLQLIEQGFSREEIKKKLEETSKKKTSSLERQFEE
jgi:transcriptional regulator